MGGVGSHDSIIPRACDTQAEHHIEVLRGTPMHLVPCGGAGEHGAHRCAGRLIELRKSSADHPNLAR